jgi:hypothetical protein
MNRIASLVTSRLTNILEPTVDWPEGKRMSTLKSLELLILWFLWLAMLMMGIGDLP